MSMDMEIPGIHHVTAVTGDASGNVDFYTRVLGLRLVKKTVNQDDVSAYHLFYADRNGSPGTDLTFFDWPRSPRARAGAATIAPVALRVPAASALTWWERRLSAQGVPHEGISEVEGRRVLAFRDPEGQRLELVDDEGRPGGVPWEHAPVPPEHAIRGLHDVTITSVRPESTGALLTTVLGFRQVATYERTDPPGLVTVFETGEGGPGTQVRVVGLAPLDIGSVGIGGVHHVAFRTPDEARQRQWRERIERVGLNVTPVIDRFYFHSIYFREPGGALFEIATDGPGFTADEPESELGRHLALPPFLEPRRREIEAGLRPIAVAIP
jgi:glyoxalase family protein